MIGANRAEMEGARGVPPETDLIVRAVEDTPQPA